MSIGRFYAGVAAVIRERMDGRYLLLRRSYKKDFGAGAWECPTGRVDQGEGFEQAAHREASEELGFDIQIDGLLGTTHFYRGEAIPENELVGVIFLCSVPEARIVHLGEEHSEYHWLSADQALKTLSPGDPSQEWIRRVIERAEMMRRFWPDELSRYYQEAGFDL
jgi:8-oxo-dGTP pyrophosphatase MutT (NUDIX family)